MKYFSHVQSKNLCYFASGAFGTSGADYTTDTANTGGKHYHISGSQGITFEPGAGRFTVEETGIYQISLNHNDRDYDTAENNQKDWAEIILIDGKKVWVPLESIRPLK